jgi:hypothetical protein
MKDWRRISLWLAGTFAAAWILAAIAQDGGNIVATDAPAPGLPSTNAYPRSPVDIFRELLAMKPEERVGFVAQRYPQAQNAIEAKLVEYEMLPADEREWRLQATELHWYLLPLMKIPPAQREARLEEIPPDMRKLVKERLDIWSILPPPLSDQLLEHEQVARLLSQTEGATAAQQRRILESLTPAERRRLDAGIQRWQEIGEQQRQQICQQFNEFFDLTKQEKERALNTLSEAERRQMERTLREFESLPREQRETCVSAFQKFTTMSLPERELFLRNAERWKQMTPEERQSWRNLVAQVPIWPPMPPQQPPPMPQ